MIYVASPYTHKTPSVQQERYEEIVRVTAGLMLNYPQHVFYSPVVHCHPLDLARPGQFTYHDWIKHSQEFLAISQAMWVVKMVGWNHSKGVQGELMYCQRARMPVFYVNPRTSRIIPLEAP